MPSPPTWSFNRPFGPKAASPQSSRPPFAAWPTATRDPSVPCPRPNAMSAPFETSTRFTPSWPKLFSTDPFSRNFAIANRGVMPASAYPVATTRPPSAITMSLMRSSAGDRSTVTLPSPPNRLSKTPRGPYRASAHFAVDPLDVKPPIVMLPLAPITTAFAPWYFLPKLVSTMPSPPPKSLFRLPRGK